MKKIALFLLISLIVPIAILSPTKSLAQEENLIINPSAEIVDANNQPEGWLKGNWGANSASFSYNQTSGQDGTKSLDITMNSWQSGDAKWYFEPVIIEPSTQYYFRDYYKSNVGTEIVAQIENSNGNLSYLWIADIAPSSNWQLANYNFTSPSYAHKITIFHLIKSVGSLSIDNLQLRTATVVTTTGNVPNSSLEQQSDLSPNQPLSWLSNSWGSNKATFSYLSDDGHTGTHSVKTQIKSYSSGDAKWYYSPQPVTAGQSYKFTDYYKSNIGSYVVLAFEMPGGVMRYENLKAAAPASTWTKYSDAFTAPEEAVSLTVFHLINAVGYVITDDYSVEPFTISGFDQGLISLTFDDSWEINIDAAFPILNQYGFKITQYLATQYIVTTEDKNTIKSIFNAGNEIGSHSVTHPFLTQLSSRKLSRELSNSKTFLESIVGKGNVKHFATPYGDYSFNVLSTISDYYQSNRNTDAGYNYKDNFDIYNIRVQNMTPTTTFTEFKAWVDKAIADKTWLVIVYHRVASDPEPYDVLPNQFELQMEYLDNSGIAVKTVSDALAEILPQISN